MPEHKECLISGSKEIITLGGYERHHLVISKPVGFVFCSKIPSQEELIAHYNTYSRAEITSPVTKTRYNELLDAFEPYKVTGRILDVGCGVGLFLVEAKKRGWEVHGTEFTAKAIDICLGKGINMAKGKLSPLSYEPGSFDIVTSFEVLEHINNPLEEVRNINSVLRKGGLFYFTTPNFNALERLILRDKYNIITYPEHLCYYTKKTVHHLLSNNGFSGGTVVTTGVSINRILGSSGIGSPEAGVTKTLNDEEIREGFETSSGALAKRVLNYFLDLFGIGNSLKGYYHKSHLNSNC